MMLIKSNEKNMRAIVADITTLPVDAIVNAARNSLLGGGGVDGAIHRAAGPELIKACQKLDGCITGNAKITVGFNLPSRYIIHTVAPVWRGGEKNEAELLASCYRRCMELSDEYSLNSIAFSCLGIGSHFYPAEQAAAISIQTVRPLLEQSTTLNEVIFCCFSERDWEIYHSFGV